MADDGDLGCVHQPRLPASGTARPTSLGTGIEDLPHGLGTRGRPGLRGHARRVGPRGRGDRRGRPRGARRRGRPRGEPRWRPAPCDARGGVGLLRLQRPRRRDRVGARARRRARRLRRRRRPPRRRRRARVLGRPARADDLAARAAEDAVPRHRVAHRVGGPGAEGSAVNVGAPAEDGRRPAGCGPSTPSCLTLLGQFRPQLLVTQHGCDSHCAGPAGPPGADGGRPARELPRAARARPPATRTDAGSRSAVAATPSSMSCLARGRTSWARSSAARSMPATARAAGLARYVASSGWAARACRTMTDGASARPRPWADGWDDDDPIDRAVLRHAQRGLPAARPRSHCWTC